MEQIRKFTRDNDIVTTFTYNPDTTTDTLPVGIYRLAFNPMAGFYLKYLKASFELPSKVYGKNKLYSDKVFNTYQHKDTSTGALFVGEKGNGKTLLSKMIANRALESEVPVIIIDSNFDGQNIVPFISSLGDTCLLFDEFEKIFDDESQIKLLSLFDGIYSAKRLILLTANAEYKINNFLLDRPGRILYKFKFGKVSTDVIREICLDNGVPESFILDLIEVVKRTASFSVDSLNAIIEEYLRYKEPLSDILEVLNIDITTHTWIPTILESESLTKNYKITGIEKCDRNTKGLKITYGPAGGDDDDQWSDYVRSSHQDIILEDGQKVTYLVNGDFKVTAIWDYESMFEFKYGAL